MYTSVLIPSRAGLRRPMRIICFSRTGKKYGYTGLFRHDYQALQEKRWWGWKTISRHRPLRVIRFSRMERKYGHMDLFCHNYQALQEKRWWGWKTMVTEEIPSHVPMAKGATLGYGESEWTSMFSALGSLGSDGQVIPRKYYPLSDD